MNSPNDIADLAERIHRVSRSAGPQARVGNSLPAPAEIAPPPPLPSLEPFPSPNPVPLAEVSNMVPRAREKVKAGSKAPGILRPMFRNQGGINGILVETCNRLVDVGQQLRQENDQLRARLDELTDYIVRQHDWLESLAHGCSLDRQAVYGLQALQTSLADSDELTNRVASLEAREDENASTLARLETQTEHTQRWMLGFQVFVDEQGMREAGLREQIAGDLQAGGQRSALSAEDKQAIDSRLDAMDGHLNSLQEQSDAQAARLDGVVGHLNSLQEQGAAHTARLDGVGGHLNNLQEQSDAQAARLDGVVGHLNSLQEQSHQQNVRLDGLRDRVEEVAAKADAADTYTHEVHGHLDKLGGHFQSSLDGFGSRLAETEDKVKWSREHLDALQAQADGQGAHLAGLQSHADGLSNHLTDLQGHNDRENEHVNVLQRRLDEAVEACDRARADLSAATTTQRYLEESNRRLDERQINDASYLRAQLGFHQRLFSHWLAPTLTAGPSAAAATNPAAGNDPLALGGSPENTPPDAIFAPPDENTTLAATTASGDVANAASVIARRKAAAAFSDHEMDALYLAFEDAMRGNRYDIKERLREYVPHLQNARVGSASSPVLDLGCGRGEWLEILRENGFTASGVDLNAVMIDQCRARRLNATLANAIDHLAALEDASVGAVTAFHLIEHLPFPVLVQFFNECRRVLQPGGLAIFETPNPTNVLVGSCFFWHDYTHQRPLPPLSTRFLVEHVGFAKVEILPLHPWSEEGMVHGDGTNPALVARFNELFYGPQDYAVLARVGGAGVIT